MKALPLSVDFSYGGLSWVAHEGGRVGLPSKAGILMADMLSLSILVRVMSTFRGQKRCR